MNIAQDRIDRLTVAFDEITDLVDPYGLNDDAHGITLGTVLGIIIDLRQRRDGGS